MAVTHLTPGGFAQRATGGGMQTANVTSGVAPLGVTFDLTVDPSLPQPANNASGKPDWSLTHAQWDDGDSGAGAGTYTTTGLSKNSDTSCQHAHTFEVYDAGAPNKTVTLTITEADGTVTNWTQVITITNPETVFAGALTKYARASGNDTTGDGSDGNPYQTFGKLLDVVHASNGPRRGLLEDGETFALASTKSYTTALVGPFLIGKKGSGANPIITKSSSGNVISLGATMTVGTRFVDIDLQLSGSASGFRPGSQCLYLRCTVTGGESGFTTSSAFGEINGTIIQECTLVNQLKAGSSAYGIYWNFGYRCAILGCLFTWASSAGSTPHQGRLYLSHSSIKHCKFTGTGGAGQLLTVHGWSGGLSSGTAATTQTLEYTVFSDLIFDGLNAGTCPSAWSMNVQNVQTDGRIQNCIIERCSMVAGASYTFLLELSGQWCTIRNSRFNGSASSGVDCIRITRTGVEPIPTGNNIYQNSFFSTGTIDVIRLFNSNQTLLNGSFTNNTPARWTLGAGWSITATKLLAAAGSASDCVQTAANQKTDLPLVIGETYVVTITVDSISGAGAAITLKCGTAAGAAITTTGVKTQTIVCAGNTDFTISKNDTCVAQLDSVSAQPQNQPLLTVAKNNHAMTGLPPSGGAIFLADVGTSFTDVGNTRTTVGFTDPANGDWSPTASILGTVTILAPATYDFNKTARGSIGGTTTSASTLGGVPTVTTASASAITASGATAGGNVTAGGGSSVTARGCCISTSANPTTADTHTSDGTGTGAFTSTFTGLAASTLYHYRSYATNTGGTSYGSDLTFTTTSSGTSPSVVTTTSVSSITATTATSGGEVTSEGSASVTARGVCWSTSVNPTTADSKTTDSSGLGVFVSSLTGLTQGTLYHVRAYSTSSVATVYGDDVTFTTLLVLPTVTTDANATDVTTTTAVVTGNVVAIGNSAVTTRFITWNLTGTPTVSDHAVASGSGAGAFSPTLSDLPRATRIYARAGATNTGGTAYGAEVSFYTANATGRTWHPLRWIRAFHWPN